MESDTSIETSSVIRIAVLSIGTVPLGIQESFKTQAFYEEFGQPKACIEAKKKQPPNSNIQSSLKQEALGPIYTI
nr:hypothetical protein CFP56_48090 [Quercus suber]